MLCSSSDSTCLYAGYEDLLVGLQLLGGCGYSVGNCFHIRHIRRLFTK